MAIIPPAATKKTKPNKANFTLAQPLKETRAFIAHPRFRVDLPLGRSKQTIMSEPSACQVPLFSCSGAVIDDPCVADHLRVDVPVGIMSSRTSLRLSSSSCCDQPGRQQSSQPAHAG